MSPLLQPILLLLHLLAAALWVGGMATMHFAVRPAAVQVLEGPLRAAFLAAALGRFFAWVGAAIVVLLASGLAMVQAGGGFGAAQPSVHVMAAIGIVMMAIFGHIRFALYPRLRRALAAKEPAAAAQALGSIRRQVALNLALGVVVFGVAVLGRAF